MAYGEWCPTCGAEIMSVTRGVPSMGTCANGHKTDRRDVLRREPESELSKAQAENARMRTALAQMFTEAIQLRADLADMTQQRDAAMAGAVKGDDLRGVLTALITEQSEGEWDDGTIEKDVEVFLPRILSALTPDPDRMLALTAAAYDDAADTALTTVEACLQGDLAMYVAERVGPNIMGRTPADAIAALFSIEAQAEARGHKAGYKHAAETVRSMRATAGVLDQRTLDMIAGLLESIASRAEATAKEN